MGLSNTRKAAFALRHWTLSLPVIAPGALIEWDGFKQKQRCYAVGSVQTDLQIKFTYDFAFPSIHSQNLQSRINFVSI